MKKYFIAALALVAAVACSKDDASDPILNNSMKSVTISIANMEQTTRAPFEAGETNEGVTNTLCTSIDANFYFMFADDAGNIVKVVNGNDATAQASGKYLFHAIPQNATQIAGIGNYTGTAPAVGDNISTYEAAWSAESQATISAEYTSLLAYGHDHLTNTGGFCEVTSGSQTHTYHLYEAEMTISPYMSRIEITHIGCTDFGNYDKIAVCDFGLAAGKYVKSFASFTSDADLTDAAKTPYVLTTAHVHGSDTNVVAPTAGDVWSWNIAPQSVTNLVTKFYVHNAYTTLAVPYRTVTINKYEVGGTKINNFAAGNIYRFAIDFSHKNFDGSDDSYICAEVAVTIGKWTVNDVKVSFNTNN